jgi:hypothetical protein
MTREGPGHVIAAVLRAEAEDVWAGRIEAPEREAGEETGR